MVRKTNFDCRSIWRLTFSLKYLSQLVFFMYSLYMKMEIKITWALVRIFHETNVGGNPRNNVVNSKCQIHLNSLLLFRNWNLYLDMRFANELFYFKVFLIHIVSAFLFSYKFLRESIGMMNIYCFRFLLYFHVLGCFNTTWYFLDKNILAFILSYRKFVAAVNHELIHSSP